MKDGIKPNNRIDLRFTKQLFYFSGLLAATLFAPLFLGLSLEVVLLTVAVIGGGLIAEKLFNTALSQNLKKTHNKLLIKCLIQATVSLLLLNAFQLPMEMFIGFVGPMIATCNLKDFLAIFKLPTVSIEEIPSSLIQAFIVIISNPFEATNRRKKKTSLKNIPSDELILSDTVHLAVKAGLRQVMPLISESDEINAYANTATQTVTICRGLINTLKKRELIAAVIAHEIAHLTRDAVDRIFQHMPPILGELLIGMGIASFPVSTMPYSIGIILGVIILVNATKCGILQAEEERADRFACHYLENPEKSIETRKILRIACRDEMTLARSISEDETMRKLSNLCNTFHLRLTERENSAYELGAKILGRAKHPSEKHRIHAIEDEIRKNNKVKVAQ